MSSVVTWQPTLGAIQEQNGITFRVWAPSRQRVELVLQPGSLPVRHRLLRRTAGGIFTGTFGDVAPGDRYAYLVDGEGPFPDPASRFQPEGVHGPSAVVAPSAYHWADAGWRGVALRDAVLYELHVGTFSPEGTFAGVTSRLPYLAELGVTAVQLMPLADFPGSSNWGYDGVSLFAPSRAYGTPDDLRRLVDQAHSLDLAVLLDVVYNHFGPDGAYASTFSPLYLSTRHHSPWGASVNLDGDGAAEVREFFIENALHWLHEYHLDGLRLDATHGLIDDSPRHFVAELASRARASLPERTILLMAEDERNLASIVRSEEEGGWGLDAVWADDFHHHVRRRTAGDRDGYYEDFSGTAVDIATTIRQGWFYTGQWSRHRDAPRGTDPSGIARERMVVCIQNHDQVGNRPFGGRLNHQIDPPTFRALSALLLFLPETPLLFMGQEWAASSRFMFFTDHHTALGQLVSEGRRAEFSRFEAFADPVVRLQIPDPQARSTFDESRLRWDEQERPPHKGTLELYRELLWIRKTEPALRRDERLEVVALDDDSLVVVRGTPEADILMLVVCLAHGVRADVERWRKAAGGRPWRVALQTDEPRFADPPASDTRAPRLECDGPLAVAFSRPGAVILEPA